MLDAVTFSNTSAQLGTLSQFGDTIAIFEYENVL